jgi:hypothetical protein
VANETFEVKAELFDINSNLVYTNLKTIQSFDTNGYSLIPYIPGGSGDPSLMTFVSGSLEISRSLVVGEDALIEGSLQVDGLLTLPYLSPCPGSDSNSRRLIWWDGADGRLCRSPIINIQFDDQYVSVITGSNPAGAVPDLNSPSPLTGKSVRVTYDGSSGGRQIYWNGATKVVNTT